MTDELASRRKRRAKRTKKPKPYKASENPKNGPGKRCSHCGEPMRDHIAGGPSRSANRWRCPLIPLAVGVAHRTMVVWIPERRAPKRKKAKV